MDSNGQNPPAGGSQAPTQAPDMGAGGVSPSELRQEVVAGISEEWNAAQQAGGDSDAGRPGFEDFKSQVAGALADDKGDDVPYRPEDTPQDSDDDEGGGSGASPAGPVGIDEALIQKAARLGISKEDALAAGSPEALNAQIERQAYLLGRFMQQRRAAAGQPQPGQTPPPQQQQVSPPAGGAPQGPPAGQQQATTNAPQGVPSPYQFQKVEVDEQEYGREFATVVKNVEAMHNHYSNTVQAVQQQMAQLQQLQSTLLHVGDLRDVDRFVGELGDEFHETFGAGPTSKLSPQSKQLQARAKLLEAKRALIAGYLSTGQMDLPMVLASGPELLEAAFNHAFPEHAKRKQNKRVAQGRDKRNGQFIAPPTGGRGKKTGLTARQEAAIGATRMWNKYEQKNQASG